MSLTVFFSPSRLRFHHSTVIRGLALGTLNDRTRSQFLAREVKMAATLSLILSTAGFIRAIAFRTPFPEALTVTAALSLIVFSSICLGAVLPLVFRMDRRRPSSLKYYYPSCDGYFGCFSGCRSFTGYPRWSSRRLYTWSF